MASQTSEVPLFNREPPTAKRSVFEDDFLYGVTVAQTSIDLRLGKMSTVEETVIFCDKTKLQSSWFKMFTSAASPYIHTSVTL